MFTEVASSASRHSDVNLVEVGMGEGTVREDDRAVLLEGGGLQPASPKARSSSAFSPIFRFLKNNHRPLGFSSPHWWLSISLCLLGFTC